MLDMGFEPQIRKILAKAQHLSGLRVKGIGVPATSVL